MHFSDTLFSYLKPPSEGGLSRSVSMSLEDGIRSGSALGQKALEEVAEEARAISELKSRLDSHLPDACRAHVETFGNASIMAITMRDDRNNTIVVVNYFGNRTGFGISPGKGIFFPAKKTSSRIRLKMPCSKLVRSLVITKLPNRRGSKQADVH